MTAALAWSGGKDSLLALDRATARGIDVRWLFNVFEGSSGRVRFHGTPAAHIAAQAAALGRELFQARTHPDDFETVFRRALGELRDRGVRTLVFGNIHLADVRAWYEQRTREFGFEHVEPLWGEAPSALVREFVQRGHRSMICSVDLKQGKREWLGRTFDAALIAEIEAHGADPCGERGEYHSFSYGGPLFRKDLAARAGRQVEMEGHALVEIELTAAPAPSDRYSLGPEIGHGGLGRVHSARDRKLDREVAVKVMREDLPASLEERFVREAKLTARLDHPQIVPIHDFGTIEGESEPRVFIAMKRIRGRDLRGILKAIRDGEPAATEAWTRARLLGVLEGVCLGVAYAHAQGVIHRDLKPANIMLGDFGEVTIVDWGLAKEAGVVGEVADGEASSAGGDSTLHRALPSDLTLQGSALGTPSYMPPEQAQGRMDEVDERSDIYALGAILFEILTFQPPVIGDSVDAVLQRASAGRRSSLVPPSKGPAEWRMIAPDLAAIADRALAPRREDRFQSALDLSRELQLHLEGSRERERARRESIDRAAEGLTQLARYRDLAATIRAAEDDLRGKRNAVKPYEPLEVKRPLWEAEDRLQAMREDRVQALSAATGLIAQARAADAACPEALDAACALHYEQAVEAETARNREGALLQRALLESVDRDGRFRARLDAPGRLEVEAFRPAGAGLRPRPGIRVTYGDAPTVAWRDGAPAYGETLLDSDRPVPAIRLENEAWGFERSSPLDPVEGGEVFAAKFELRDRRLVPGEWRPLGTTPLSTDLPQGSWLVEVRAAGSAPMRFPVRIERGSRWTQRVPLLTPDELPAGFSFVAGGPHVSGGEAAGGPPESTRVTRDVLVARVAVTVKEYCEFLEALAASGRLDEARRRQPRDKGRMLGFEAEGRFRLSTELYPLCPSDDCPVGGVSWHDALAYAAWRSARDGRVYRLAHEEEWEKAARGVDRRNYPWGDVYDGTFSNTQVSHPQRPQLTPVGTFGHDESPYGIRDLAGNMRAWCWNGAEIPYRPMVSVRGGDALSGAATARSGLRSGNAMDQAYEHQGIRLAIPVWREDQALAKR